MNYASEIPCSSCHRWNSKAKSFSCNPNKCTKLAEWLFDHAQIEKKQPLPQAIEATPQYVV
jgi:hypothetical protein